MTFPFPFLISNADPVQNPLLQYRTTAIDASASVTTFTLAGLPIGPANANRQVFAVFTFGGAAANITSVTIGGVTAKAIVVGTNTTSGRQAIYSASVPSGTTATVVITVSAACTTCICSIYTSTTANIVPLDCLENFTSLNTSLVLTDLAVVNGGFVILQGRNQSNAMTITYNGIDTPVVDNTTTSGLIIAKTESIYTTENVGTNDITLTVGGNIALFSIASSFFVNANDMLDPTLRGTSILLSNSNLTASTTSGWQSAHSVNSHSSGKLYFEMTVGAVGSGIASGFCNLSSSMNNFIGNDANGIIYVQDGSVVKNNANFTNIGAFTTGDVIGQALDIGSGLVWFRKNAGNWNNNVLNDPSTGVGGIAVPTGLATGQVFAGVSINSSSVNGTVNFGATSFAHAAPSGYSAWN